MKDASLTNAEMASLSSTALDRLMPMHLLLDGRANVISYGPTLGRVFQHHNITPDKFFDLFAVRRPTGVSTARKLSALVGERVQLTLKAGEDSLSLRGLCQEMAGAKGFLLNLSFGIGVVDAVRVLSLTEADFAPTDLAIEMLYLVEAKSAVMRELRDLNLRLQEARLAAEQQALTDTLTGLRNRRALESEMHRLIGRGTSFALFHLDLDYFKQVNDTLGHAAGDFVLRQVADILSVETRTSDTVARVGGDEFVIILNRVEDYDFLLPIAGRIIAALTVPMDFEGQVCKISGSIGITLSTNYPSPDIEVLHADADAALYESKRAGRGRATVFQTAPPVANLA